MSDKLATLKAKNSISFKALESGETEVSFVVDKLNYGEKTRIRASLEEAGDTLTIAVSKYRKRRSLSANAYFWELIGRLSKKLNISKEETYWEYIKHTGIYQSVEVNNKAVDTIIKMWKSHGLGWIAEKTDDGEREGFSLINLYYGSSSYNTKQMSRLIDSVVNDCKEQGIETLPPEQLECMKREWKSERFS